tara:strand:+ start:994 stop:1230 length:237 start_codon:yes stop_codon:yes gene_type:complete
MSVEKEEKKYQIDISQFPELQDAIMEYFLLMTEILNMENFEIEEIKMNLENSKIIVKGSTAVEKEEEPSEEESDWEWI